MAPFPSLLIVWFTICLYLCNADDSFRLHVHREEVDIGSANAFAEFSKRQTGSNPVGIGKSLYWFGNFTVGDSPQLRLLIDTGSSDTILNPGLYKPSAQAKPYKHKAADHRFSILFEGVNRKGFGFESLNGTVTRDIVSAEGVTVPEQPVGAVDTFIYYDTHQQRQAMPGEGIIGFLGRSSSSFNPPSQSWFFRLCQIKGINVCKFGLAFGTSGKGVTVIGELAKDLFTGGLVVVERVLHPFGAWTVFGDVILGGSQGLTIKNQTLIMDCGTNNLQGPIVQVKKIFKALGLQTVEANGGPNPFNPKAVLKTLTAVFPCDKPPKIGFSFPAASGRVFNVALSEWGVFPHRDNNCTSILGGTNALSDPNAWLVGQPFFAGHYVDLDIEGTLGFADLVDPTMSSA